MGIDSVEDDAARDDAQLQMLLENYGPPRDPPTICPACWPDSITKIRTHLSESSASYACANALKLLKGIDDETIQKAVYAIEQTFTWIGYDTEIMVNDPDGLIPARYVLDGALQYMEYCVNELPASDIVDGLIGPSCDDAMIYSLLAISLFVQAAQWNFLETLELPPPRPPEYADIIGTACYAASEAKNRRAINELRARLPMEVKAAQAAARKKQSQKALAARHKENIAASALVLKWWNEEGDYAKYRTKSAVYQKYLDALEAEGIMNGKKPFERSTVERWLAKGRAAEGKAKA